VNGKCHAPSGNRNPVVEPIAGHFTELSVYSTENIFQYIAVYGRTRSYLPHSSHFSNHSTQVSALPRFLVTFFHKNMKNAKIKNIQHNTSLVTPTHNTIANYSAYSLLENLTLVKKYPLLHEKQKFINFLYIIHTVHCHQSNTNNQPTNALLLLIQFNGYLLTCRLNSKKQSHYRP
jgi:hypothetical protein